ncbi:MAG: methyltransferase domain-containing protein [Steroidobacteraceae bacterium]
MMTSTGFFRLCIATTAIALPLVAAAQDAPAKSEAATRIEAALASSIRTADERARDQPERKPLETLEFFGLQPDMHVIELLPGRGWYTKVLAPVLADKGKLSLAIGAKRLAPLLTEWGLDKVEVLDDKTVFKPTGQYGIADVESLQLPAKNVDMVLTFRNMHNLTAPSRALLNAEVFRALKPGGIYGIVDHTRRHMEPATSETWRRIDPVLVIKEVTAAGFEFVDYSDLHYRPDDSLQFDSQRISLQGYSDRFTLKFRKPR